MKSEPISLRFFRHLREGQLLRENPLTLLAVGEAARTLPPALLVRAVHDRADLFISRREFFRVRNHATKSGTRSASRSEVAVYCTVSKNVAECVSP